MTEVASRRAAATMAAAAAAFAYRAVDATGRRRRGVERSESAQALARALEARGLVVLEVTAAREAAPQGARAPRRRQGVLDATRALAQLLPAGLPLAAALATAAELAGGATAAVLLDVRERVTHGDALAASLARHRAFFPPLYVGVVNAGERSGNLAGAFATLADQLEREDQLRARLLSALLYPALLAVAGCAAVALLLGFVLPRFAEVLTGIGAQLPASTRLLLAAGTAFRRDWLPVSAALGALLVGAALVAPTPRGRRAVALLLVRAPGVGALRRQLLAARFARLVAVLLGGGAPVLAALDEAAASLADPLAAEEARRIRVLVREGSTLHGALAAGSLFPPLLAQLAALGDRTGRLRDALLQAAGLLEERTERALQRLVTLAEPLLIVLFGGAIAFVALALLQAIYGVNAGALR